jgi:hypothetical protein
MCRWRSATVQATTTAAVTPSARPTVMLAKRSFIMLTQRWRDDGMGQASLKGSEDEQTTALFNVSVMVEPTADTFTKEGDGMLADVSG